MSGGSDIDARLRRLAGDDEAAAGGRLLARADDGAEAVARAVLDAVDETVLPAELSVASGAGQALVLSVAGRRLRAILSASDGLEAGDLIGAELDAEDEGGLARAAALLDRFARGASGAVTLREARGADGGARGVSANRLAGLLPEGGAAPAETADGCAADRFLSGFGQGATATLVQTASGDETTAGDADLHDTLSAIAGMAPEDAIPALNVWLRQTGPADGRAFARAAFDDGSLAALAFPAGEAAALTAAFRAAAAT